MPPSDEQVQVERPRFYATIPAAGLSRRMGGPKLLLPWDGSTVIEAVIEAWRSGGVSEIAVVIRKDDAALGEVCDRTGVAVVRPAVDPVDMKASLQAAVEYLRTSRRPTGRDAWLFAPADMPQLSPAVIRRLCAAHDPDRPEALVPTFEGRRGHPVLAPWSWTDLLADLAPEEGLKHLLSRRPWREIAVADRRVLGDLDTPEDYRRAVGGYTSPG